MKNKSFTLIELLVVIVIIGILAGVIIVSVSSSINKANFAKAQSFSNTVQNELLGDLVSEWTFDIASNPGEDTWGNNDGTVYGAATHKTKADGVCVYGGCYSFDGTNDYIDCGNNSSLNMGSGDFTLIAWIKTSAITYQHIIGKRGSDASNWYRIFIDVLGKIRLELAENYPTNSPVSPTSLISVNDGVWHFVVGVRDGTALKIYVDGIERISGTSNYNVDNSANFLIGQYATIGGNSFDGLIDDARVYDAALSLSQIRQEYIAGLNSLLASNNISKEEYNQRLNALAYAE